MGTEPETFCEQVPMNLAASLLVLFSTAFVANCCQGQAGETSAEIKHQNKLACLTHWATANWKNILFRGVQLCTMKLRAVPGGTVL